MLDIFMYVQTPEQDCSRLFEILDLQPRNWMASDGGPVDFTHFDRSENAFYGEEVTGDFRFAGDLYLFGRNEFWLHRALLLLSSQGHMIAVPDEMTLNPTAFQLYRNGAIEYRCIETDDREDADDGRVVIRDTYVPLLNLNRR